MIESTDLEGPFWRTIRTVLRHPGRLTREYSERRFASQVSPLRLYLAMAALYFFLLPLWGEWTVGSIEPGSVSQSFRVNFPPRATLAIMVPVWAALVRFLLKDKKVHYEEAFVFSAHFHVGVMLGFAVTGCLAALLTLIGFFDAAVMPFGLFLLAIPVYVYVGMREGFGVGRLRAIVSTVLLLGSYGLAMELINRLQ